MVSLRDSIYTAEQSRNILNYLIDFHESQNKRALEEKEFRLQRNRQLAYLGGAGILLLIVILLFSYRALILRKRMSERLNELVDSRTHELSDTNKMLLKSRNELDTFLYRTSHDIRGPIATLMGLTGLARIEGPEKITGALLEKMDISSNKVNEIITRLTNVSLINGRDQEITRINPFKIAENIVEDIRSKQGTEAAKIRFSASGNHSEEIQTDEILFKTVLYNLLENSFKFYDRREELPEVKLQMTLNNRYEINVIDNGIGIDSSFKDKLFGIFFAASEKRGAGLGLYQARLAAQKLGGNLTLVSYKKPTNFHVSLPLL